MKKRLRKYLNKIDGRMQVFMASFYGQWNDRMYQIRERLDPRPKKRFKPITHTEAEKMIMDMYLPLIAEQINSESAFLKRLKVGDQA